MSLSHSLINATAMGDIRKLEPILRDIQSDLAAMKTFADEQKAVIDELHDNSTINIKTAFMNMCLGDAGIAMSVGTPEAVKTTAAVDYLIDGVFYSLGATDPFWDLTGFDVSDGYVNKCLLCVDAAGNDQIVAGTEALAAADVVLGTIPAAYSVVGMLQVASAGAAFTGGTTALSAGTVTDTYFDMAFHPDLIAVPGSAKPTAVGALQTQQE